MIFFRNLRYIEKQAGFWLKVGGLLVQSIQGGQQITNIRTIFLSNEQDKIIEKVKLAA